MTPSWLPDWKLPLACRPPTKGKFQWWAWQFLRRSPAYRADYSAHIAPYIIDGGFDEDLVPFSGKVCDPPARQGETEATYLARMRRQDCTIKSPCSHVMKKYGLKLLPPDPAHSDFLSLFDTTPVQFLLASAIRRGIQSWHDEDMAIVFNLAWPLIPQLTAAKGVLEGRAQHLAQAGKVERVQLRARVDNFPTYLRLLDAKAAEAGRREMADVIFPKVPNEYPSNLADARVRDSLRAAERLRDSDYRYLVFADRQTAHKRKPEK